MTSEPEPLTQQLLARAHSPDSANRIFTEKIQHRPILLRPSSPPPTANAREARRRARRQKEKERAKALKPKPLSARRRRALGLYEVPKEGRKYALFEPLHQLWLGYMREILGSEIYTGGQGAAAKLSSADFHGAEVEVSRSGCVSRVGIKGIVIKDSRFVFEIITKNNKLKVVPKEGTVFRVEIPPAENDEAKKQDDKAAAGSGVGEEKEAQGKLIFDIHGSQFLFRAADRANKKFKQHFSSNI